ncbi:BREX-1 system adenine-specific DNA-methyltransferase PglX [Geomonas sp. Red69]|uniref:BREX-1 system adenine-specific DNA-methyltransferase PglX n=1 Tax=Geomonas diazotrophica TaxID=2843197 RepID=UPI001C114369|nr:BREX-1 system adenine-specific DNA-methyltransferase PglX [Geomonas diazotrophica]MBU5638829.1 BREX-1 system adenine-specific DNA-methyltransferase PglX [Geomonas diazotrophica]
MAFDQSTRNRLQKFVSDARGLLSEEFTRQLQNDYGLDPHSGAVTPLENLGDLDDSRRETARILRETLAHYMASSPSGGNKEALDRIVREQAFTVLNRLAALRMAESRGILIESVGNGYQSKGFQLYERLAGPGLGETGDTYRCYVFSIFDEFALDLKVLFDRFSPQGRLFPREAALLELLNLLNDQELAHLWAEDETIGWVYQYFNSKEERKKMRDESAAPRNSRELAVRNQFFTPRYVVEFLTDNTLGRIWYEMTQGKTDLKESCRYLVRRPTEIFLKAGEKAPEQPGGDQNLSQEELLKQPAHIQFRPLKDPRTLRMLDPACGSMHFGLYAFDLYEQIYAEAWGWEVGLGTGAFVRENGLKPITESYQDKESFLQDVPRLIIEHNIHGIDIDPRAAQIAGLSLWLRAQRSWHNQGVKPAARPRISRSNIVCAEPMPGEKELLREFTASLEVPALGYLVEQVFDKMQLAGEAGSLLKIDEEIRDIIAEAKRQWKAGPKLTQMGLFGEAPAKPEQVDLPLDFTGITDERFWDGAEEKLYWALQEYAEVAGEHGYQRRMFAEDAARGFAFIDVCRKRYDIVLMNPPFGRATDRTFEALKKEFPASFIDMYCAFIEQAVVYCPKGIIGAITSRSFLNAVTLQEFRDKIVSYSAIIADLGSNVLDNAMVEVAASVFTDFNNKYIQFFDLQDALGKCNNLLACTDSNNLDLNNKRTYFLLKSKIPSFAKHQFLYKSDGFTVDSKKVLEPDVAIVRAGLNTFDNFRFLRCWWEVHPTSIGQQKRWEFFSKGGEYETFFDNIHLVIKRADNGKELAAVNENANGQIAQSRQSYSRYYIPGLIYTIRSARGFNVRHFPAGSVFSIKGPVIQATGNVSLYYLAGLLNSEPIRVFVQQQSNFNQYMPSIVKSIPWIEPDCETLEKVCDFSITATKAKLNLYSNNEECIYYTAHIHHAFRESIKNGSELLRLEIDESNLNIRNKSKIATIAISNLYNFGNIDYNSENVHTSDHDISIGDELETIIGAAERILSYVCGAIFGRWNILLATDIKSLPMQPDPFESLPSVSSGMLQNTQGLPAEPQDVPVDYPLRISWPGILVDDEGYMEDIANRIREAIEVIWKETAGDIEHEACEILGVRSLRDYFSKPSGFFADHLKRYSKSRRQAPIYWPLSTPSGSYTLWLYYHRLNDQTLYICVNEFVEPKLADVAAELASVRQKGSGRSRDEEKRLEKLQDLEMELQEFRDELLRLARLPWKPNQNDGVQITAAPLWKLFQLPKWKKTLKETWEKLENGEYDWAHLAYSIWPDRVKKKCVTDKSLAIAHDLEDLYVEPPASASKKRSKKATVIEDEESDL